MADELDPTVYGNNGYEFEYPVLKRDDATGARVPAAGLTGLTGYISATEGGNPIHPSLSANLQERTGKPGTYYGRILGSNINAQLFPSSGGTNYDGQYVWIVVKDAAGEVQGNTKVKAKALRKI